MSNSLDPDQAQRIVGPDLGPNCLPRLSAEDTSRQRVKKWGQLLNLSFILSQENIMEWQVRCKQLRG